MTKIQWQTSAVYSQMRAAEFALAAYKRMGSQPDLDKILEYIGEAEHQEGDEYWSKFATLSDALDDFDLFLENYV